MLHSFGYDGDEPHYCDGGSGTVFRISASGREKALHSFAVYSDGANPATSLIDVNGTLYGTTQLGGVESSQEYGTVFSATTAGTEKDFVSPARERSRGM